jgi:hypothetical protein
MRNRPRRELHFSNAMPRTANPCKILSVMLTDVVSGTLPSCLSPFSVPNQTFSL